MTIRITNNLGASSQGMIPKMYFIFETSLEELKFVTFLFYI